MRINNFLLLAVTATVQLSSLPFTSATHCWKRLGDFGCGAGYQEDGYFDERAGDGCICCCRTVDGGGFHENTCDGGNIKQAAKGCGSCMGERACYEAANSKIGDNSCVNKRSCYGLKDSSIKKYSCSSDKACKEMERTSVGTNSCGIGSDNNEACLRLWDSTIGDNSCQKAYSCTADPPEKCDMCGGFHRSLNADYANYGKNVTIENNACNLEGICLQCENDSIVPDNSCNGDKNDTYINSDGYTRCKYCSSAYHNTAMSAQYTASSTSGGRRLNDEDLNTACEDLANELLDYIKAAIEEHPAYKNFVSESITDTCNTGAIFSNHFDIIADSNNGTCTIVIDRLSNMRLVNGDEMSVNDYIEEKVDEFNSIEGFTKDYLNATDVVIEKYCDKGSKSSKSSITINGAKSGKESKSSQAVLKKRNKRMRERKSKKD